MNYHSFEFTIHKGLSKHIIIHVQRTTWQSGCLKDICFVNKTYMKGTLLSLSITDKENTGVVKVIQRSSVNKSRSQFQAQ